MSDTLLIAFGVSVVALLSSIAAACWQQARASTAMHRMIYSRLHSDDEHDNG